MRSYDENYDACFALHGNSEGYKSQIRLCMMKKETEDFVKGLKIKNEEVLLKIFKERLKKYIEYHNTMDSEICGNLNNKIDYTEECLAPNDNFFLPTLKE
jgi:hypothetical protein